MSERVAVVAGAGGALGRVTAQTLSTSGFTVVAVDRNEQALRELTDDIVREAGDATDPAAARNVIDRIAANVGPPDVLVNCLGMFRLGDTIAATPEDLRELIDVNLGAALWLSQAVAPYMRERGAGAIVHVSARPGADPAAGMVAYGLSKAALDHLVRILDVELRPQGIRVNAVAPDVLDTPTNRATFPPELLTRAVGLPAIANVIAFLVSDLAAPISGAIIPAYGA